MGHKVVKWRFYPASTKSNPQIKISQIQTQFHPHRNIRRASTSACLNFFNCQFITMTCKFCNDLDARSHSGGFLVDFSDLQESCRFCLLLRRLVRHFAPSIDAGQLKSFPPVDQQGDDVIDVEVAAKGPLEGPGSPTTSALFYLYNPSSSYPCD